MKFYVVVRYGPNGQPHRFYNTHLNCWEKELSKDCFYTTFDFASVKSDDVEGFVETYNVEREIPKSIRTSSNSQFFKNIVE